MFAMIKSAALALILLPLGVFPAYAYTDRNAGYSISDHNPEAIIRSSNVYAFTDKNLNNIAVHTYSAAEVETLTGIKFSTEIFQQEYEKLALLQRSQLSLKTLPIPLLDLTKYQKDEQKIFFGGNTEDREADIRIDKFNKLHAVTFCYPADKENTAAYVSFVSDNDRLYIITFSANDMVPTTLDNENSAAIKNAVWQQYLHSVKTFKTSKPQISADKSLQYYDAVNKRNVALPADWVYIQTNFKDQYNQGCLTASLPLGTMRALTKIIKQEFKINSFDDVKQGTDNIISKEVAIFADTDILRQQKQTGQQIAAALGETLITASLKVKDDSWQDLFAQPDASQMEFTSLLEYSLQRLQNLNDEYFTLNNYEYSVDFDSQKACMSINSNIALYKEYLFDTLAQVYCTPKQKINCLLYLKRQDELQQLNIANIQTDWQF